MTDAAQKYADELSLDVFERISFAANPQQAGARAGLTPLETRRLAAPRTGQIALPSGWSACVVCSDPGFDEFPGIPTDPTPL